MMKEKGSNKLAEIQKRWGVIFRDAHPLRDAETLKRYQDQYKFFTLMRSEVIDEALDIENFLTVIILHFLVGKDYSRHKLLRALVFEAEFCSFMQKRKMLSLIFEMYPKAFPFLSDAEAKRVRRELNDLILDRDMFAHGTIVIAGPEGKVIIEYYRGGKTETELNEETLPRILHRCEYLREQFKKINDFLRDNRVDVTDEA
jgi:hypothetical protein